MKDLKNILLEKLVINKDSETEVEPPKSVKRIYLPAWDHRDHMKMTEYRQKGSDPKRLVNSIKDSGKLLRRLRWAKEKGWSACARVFGDAAIQRGYYTKEEIDAYLNS